MLCFFHYLVNISFFQIEGDLGEYANTPRTIPFFLGICMSILGLVFLYQYKLGFRPKQSGAIKKNEIRNIIICVILFLIYAYVLELFGFILSTNCYIFYYEIFAKRKKLEIKFCISNINDSFNLFYFYNFIKIKFAKRDINTDNINGKFNNSFRINK